MLLFSLRVCLQNSAHRKPGIENHLPDLADVRGIRVGPQTDKSRVAISHTIFLVNGASTATVKAVLSLISMRYAMKATHDDVSCVGEISRHDCSVASGACACRDCVTPREQSESQSIARSRKTGDMFPLSYYSRTHSRYRVGHVQFGESVACRPPPN
jgi:hypothetical protein